MWKLKRVEIRTNAVISDHHLCMLMTIGKTAG